MTTIHCPTESFAVALTVAIEEECEARIGRLPRVIERRGSDVVTTYDGRYVQRIANTLNAEWEN